MSYVLKNIMLSPFKDIKNVTITSNFGKRTFYNKITDKTISGFHKGMDMVGGKKIVAISDGIVKAVVDNIKGYNEKKSDGNYVIIEHGCSLQTKYCHMKYKSIVVKIGDYVKKGDVLGIIGASGFATGVHLHLGIKKNSKWINPKPYLLGKSKIANFLADDNNQNIYVDKYLYYQIKNGDTLDDIAKNHNCLIDDLIKLNDINYDDKLIVGNILKIPEKEEVDKNTTSVEIIKYKVKKGDNLSLIAKKYGTTWKKIYSDNISTIGNNPNLILPGQLLEIKTK